MEEVAAFSGFTFISIEVVIEIRNERGQQLTLKTSDELFGQLIFTLASEWSCKALSGFLGL